VDRIAGFDIQESPQSLSIDVDQSTLPNGESHVGKSEPSQILIDCNERGLATEKPRKSGKS
jgi:hypothetical protein